MMAVLSYERNLTIGGKTTPFFWPLARTRVPPGPWRLERQRSTVSR